MLGAVFSPRVPARLAEVHSRSAPTTRLELSMNANPKFLAATAEVDAAAVAPLPKSRRVYETGSRPDIRVPFREIEQDDTPTISISAAACPNCAAPGSKNAATRKCCRGRPATTAANA
ncbi:hypothetical protein G6F65_021220 [Rhizopus arrhizus]|nr:hypothetical protein G6F65_021220 [Rhizopus arrhizus]